MILTGTVPRWSPPSASMPSPTVEKWSAPVITSPGCALAGNEIGAGRHGEAHRVLVGGPGQDARVGHRLERGERRGLEGDALGRWARVLDGDGGRGFGAPGDLDRPARGVPGIGCDRGQERPALPEHLAHGSRAVHEPAALVEARIAEVGGRAGEQVLPVRRRRQPAARMLHLPGRLGQRQVAGDHWSRHARAAELLDTHVSVGVAGARGSQGPAPGAKAHVVGPNVTA